MRDLAPSFVMSNVDLYPCDIHQHRRRSWNYIRVSIAMFTLHGNTVDYDLIVRCDAYKLHLHGVLLQSRKT